MLKLHRIERPINLPRSVVPRVLTAIIVVPVVLLIIFFLQRPYLYGLFCVVNFGLLYEWVSLVGIRTSFAKISYAALGTVVTLLLYFVDVQFIKIFAVGLIVFWVLCIFAVLFFRVSERLMKQSSVTLPLGYILCIGGVTSFFHAGTPALAMVGLLLIVWIVDSGAYFSGSLLGSRPLNRVVSPNKTWEGTVGGVALGIFCCFVVDSLLGWLSLGGIWTWSIVVVFAVFGDLFESAMKRAAGTKDSGSILPGHGGLLDRLDSLLAASPVAFLAVVA